MLNNVNTFNSAKMKGAKDLEFQRKYNALIDLLSQQLKVLSVSESNGISVDGSGSAALGLATSTTAGALSAADWGTFNGKQDQSNELDALSDLADTAGFVKKTGDAAYEIDTNNYLLSSALSDEAFSPTWDDDTTHVPSKNAMYDVLYQYYLMLGSFMFTEENYVTNMADVTANIDALDVALAALPVGTAQASIWGAL